MNTTLHGFTELENIRHFYKYITGKKHIINLKII